MVGIDTNMLRKKKNNSLCSLLYLANILLTHDLNMPIYLVYICWCYLCSLIEDHFPAIVVLALEFITNSD